MKQKVQNLAINVFAANGWIDDPSSVVNAENFSLFDAFTKRFEDAPSIKNLRASNFEKYLFLVARDYFSLGYAAVYQQTWSQIPYYGMNDDDINELINEICSKGAFEYAIGPMGEMAKSTTQDICLMAQTLESRFIGEDELQNEETLSYYRQAFYNIGIAMGYKFCAEHL